MKKKSSLHSSCPTLKADGKRLILHTQSNVSILESAYCNYCLMRMSRTRFNALMDITSHFESAAKWRGAYDSLVNHQVKLPATIWKGASLNANTAMLRLLE